MSLIVTIYRIIYWASRDYIHTSRLWCIPLVLNFYSYLYLRYLWASPWNKSLMMMTSNDWYINNHDECSVLTIYSLYILTHTEHQTTTGILVFLIFYCKPLVTVQVSGEFYDWLIDWLTDHGVMDIFGEYLTFLLTERQMTHISTTTNILVITVYSNT